MVMENDEITSLMEQIDLIIEETVQEALDTQQEELNSVWIEYTRNINEQNEKLLQKRNFWMRFCVAEGSAIVGILATLILCSCSQASASK